MPPWAPAQSQKSSPCAEPPNYTNGSPEARLMQIFGRQVLAEMLAGPSISSDTLAAAAALAEQSTTMCIDYRHLGQHWKHPHSRGQYRLGTHPSTLCCQSRNRAQQSKQQLAQLFRAAAQGHIDLETAIVRAFMCEIGVEEEVVVEQASFAGVAAALEAELLLPLRCLNEAQRSMHQTVSCQPVPAAHIQDTVQALTAAVVSGPSGFSDWRYNCPRGRRQLEGLSDEQVELWKTPTSYQQRGSLRSHEDEAGELGFFWATKIGGPSHGFDIEGQCHLPLLCNARNKVILLSDPAIHPVSLGRVHFRLLWARPQHPEAPLEPRLWLERLNVDFDLDPEVVQANIHVWTAAVLGHAISKSEAMQVPLSVDLAMFDLLKAVSSSRKEGQVMRSSEVFVLRPSNGVCEASDYLDTRHDWVQMEEEDTPLRERALYLPGKTSGNVVQS